MSPEEIMDAYNVVIEDLQTNTANRAAAIGNSQRSLGTLAERVASPSGQTSGLANYTYDRTMRPVIDTLSASLTTSGKAQALENLLSSKLREAKNNYENSKNNYTVASTNPSGGGGNNNLVSSVTDRANTVVRNNPNPEAGTILNVGASSAGGGMYLYDINVADGKGGFTTHQYLGKTREEALDKYYRDYKPDWMKSSDASGRSSGSSGAGGGGGAGGGR